MIRISLELPESIIRRVLRNGKWDGALKAKLNLSADNSRIEEIERLGRNLSTRQRAIQKWKESPGLSPEEERVISRWNESKVVRLADQKSEARNRSVKKRDFATTLPVLRKLLSDRDPDEIISVMDIYFRTCSCGDHVIRGRNCAFKSLGGFCEKLLSCAKRDEVPWWMVDHVPVEDPDPDLTQRIARMYGRHFLPPGSKLVVSNPSEHYLAFMECGKKAKRFLEQFSLDMPLDKFLETVFQCAKEIHDRHGGEFYPRRLSNDSFWSIALPQYLRNLLPGFGKGAK
jgi:hypothetical protein